MDSREIENWCWELHQAGWIKVRRDTWRAPNGMLFRGPHGAWQVMRQTIDRPVGDDDAA